MAKVTKGTAIAEVKGEFNVAAASVAPDFMKKDAGKGMENIGVEDVAKARVELLHALSPVVVEGRAKAGEFWHTALGLSMGTSLKFIPVYLSKAYILWGPRHDNVGILARADDGEHWNPSDAEFEVHPSKDNKKHTVKWRTAKTVKESGLDQYGTYDPTNPDSPPAATLLYNYVCIFPDFPDFGDAVISLKRSQIKVAQKFQKTLMLAEKNYPLFGLVAEATAINDKNKAGDEFINYGLRLLHPVQDEKTYVRAKQLHELYKKTGVVVNVDNEDSDGALAETPAAQAKGSPTI